MSNMYSKFHITAKAIGRGTLKSREGAWGYDVTEAHHRLAGLVKAGALARLQKGAYEVCEDFVRPVSEGKLEEWQAMDSQYFDYLTMYNASAFRVRDLVEWSGTTKQGAIRWIEGAEQAGLVARLEEGSGYYVTERANNLVSIVSHNFS